jgi:hypothetical protein
VHREELFLRKRVRFSPRAAETIGSQNFVGRTTQRKSAFSAGFVFARFSCCADDEEVRRGAEQALFQCGQAWKRSKTGPTAPAREQERAGGLPVSGVEVALTKGSQRLSGGGSVDARRWGLPSRRESGDGEDESHHGRLLRGWSRIPYVIARFCFALTDDIERPEECTGVVGHSLPE